MKILQFSTSHYCRKARLALGYKGLQYQVENLTPGLHIFRLKSLTETTTTPVLLPEDPKYPQAIGDSTAIFKFLDQFQLDPPLAPCSAALASEAWMLEDWLDESLGTASRFVYYQYRSGAGRSIDPSFMSQGVIQIIRWQYQINPTTAALAAQRLAIGLIELERRWDKGPFLVGEALSVADLTAAALLSPLALIPTYQKEVPWLFDKIRSIHQQCQEPLPPGLT